MTDCRCDSLAARALELEAQLEGARAIVAVAEQLAERAGMPVLAWLRMHATDIHQARAKATLVPSKVVGEPRPVVQLEHRIPVTFVETATGERWRASLFSLPGGEDVFSSRDQVWVVEARTFSEDEIEIFVRAE